MLNSSFSQPGSKLEGLMRYYQLSLIILILSLFITSAQASTDSALEPFHPTLTTTSVNPL
jgi:hypothetical protein